jgi:hypothetical protein
MERGISTPSKSGMAKVFAGITSHERQGCTQNMSGDVSAAQKNVEYNFFVIPFLDLNELAMAKPRVAPHES